MMPGNSFHVLGEHTNNIISSIRHHSTKGKSDNEFAWISAQPLLEPLLNMHAASYMSVITYLNINVMTWSYLILRAIPAIHEINALREVF